MHTRNPLRLTALIVAVMIGLAPMAAVRAADIVSTASSDQRFSTLTRAIEAAGMAEILTGPGPFTVFAPTDEAFARLPPGTLDALLQPGNRDRLRTFLREHIVFRRVPLNELNASTQIGNGNLARLPVRGQSIPFTVGGAPLTGTQIVADNGLIYPIDGVLLP